jgi:methyl-accepting chemotaxis protein
MIKKRFGLIKNFSIPARLHTAGFLALIGVAVTCYAGYHGLQTSSEGLNASITATSAVMNQKQADMMHDALRADVLYALQTGPEGGAGTKEAIANDIEEHVAEFEASFANLNALDLDSEVRLAIDNAMPLIQTYFAAARDVSATALQDRAAGQVKFRAFMDSFSQVEQEMGILGQMIEAKGATAGTAAAERNAVLQQVVLVSAGAAALILLVSNLLIARSITKPLARVKAAIKEVATGNLGGRHSNFDRVSDLTDEVSEIANFLEVLRVRLREAIAMESEIKRTQDEQTTIVNALSVGLEYLSNGNLTNPINEPFSADYEALRNNYNRTVERLNQTMTQVVQASRSIRARADDITQASTDLAQRTENQAATLEETAAALDELTTSVKAAATGAKEMETIVQHARQEAEDNGKVVLRAVDAMNGIERSSEQISRIIGVIDDIAFQTNLLALNAGVEAARAGDSGRGFAVVASEVRALAQRSSDASKEIKELISSSTQLVGRGVEAVGSAGKALTSLVDRVSHISTLVSGIATGASQQSIALAEVNIGVTQLDQVAQRNAAMVEQSMTATQSLQQEAFSMDKLVSHFSTKSTGAKPVEAPPRHRTAA